MVSSRPIGKYMPSEIYINASTNESRIAIVEDRQLAEVWVERPENQRMVGDIYKGTVTAVLPGLQAAFVEIGQDRTAFLQVRDMMEAAGDDGNSRHGRRRPNPPPIQKLIQKGHEVVVQISKEPISTKGARITTQLSLPGRFVVLVPGGDWVGVSRKISSVHERRRLKDIVEKIRPDGYSVIVRTESRDKNERDLKRDLKRLVKNYKRILKNGNKMHSPALLHKEMGMTSSVIRDLFNENVEKLVVDDNSLYEEIIEYLKYVSPQLVDRIELYKNRKPIFDVYEIEKEIEKLNKRTVWMRRGGALVIDYAEAGTFIDVNSARFVGTDDQEENNLKTNIEAASEVARQLRLRDIGGIVVIDFIDMNEDRNRRKIVDRLIEEIKKDRAKVSVSSHLSEFGLLEMTRQRVRPNLLHDHTEPCPICMGTGRVTGPDTTLTKIERWLQRSFASTKERRYVLKVHPDVADYILENRQSRLRLLRKTTKARLQVETDISLSPQDYRLYSLKRSSDVTSEFQV